MREMKRRKARLQLVPQRSVRIAGQQRPRKRLSTLHRGDFCPRDRSSGQRRRAPHSADPDGFPPFTNATSSQHEWQTPVVGPDGDPRPPECVRERLPPARRRHIPPRASRRPGNAPSSGAGWMGIYTEVKRRQGLFSKYPRGASADGSRVMRPAIHSRDCATPLHVIDGE